MTATLLRVLPVLFSLALFVVALWTLHSELAALSGDQVWAYIRSYPMPTLGVAIALAIASYLLLAVIENLGLSYAGKSLSFGRAAYVSFVSYSFAHNVGLNLLTGASIRYRLYSADKLTAMDVGAVTLFSSLAFGVGSLALAGIAFSSEPATVLARLSTTTSVANLLGVVALTAVVTYLGLALVFRKPFAFWGWSITLPRPALAIAQVVAGALDLIASAGIVYMLMPTDLGVTFVAFAGIYTLATWAGLLSHVPGGAGVFEAVMVVMLPNVPKEDLIASLLMYRAVYYVLPLMIAAVTLAVSEVAEQRQRIDALAASVERRIAPVLAPVVGLLVFLGGVVLLLSGATPAIDSRMGVLKEFLPLPLIEFSHLIGSITGTALLVLARGLFRRLDGAYHLTVVVLMAGMAVSILKGFDFEEAIVLGVILLLLLASRGAFYRRSSLFMEPLSWAWIASILAALAGATWIGFFAYRDLSYANEMWLNFAFEGDAERFLRASAVIAVASIGFGIVRLIRPPTQATPAPTADDVERAAQIARGCDDTLGHLVTMADKHIIFSPSGKAFLMYGVHGRSWITLAGPFGDVAESRELAWRFREMSDLSDGRAVFYQIATKDLPMCLDIGLTVVKIGEEAHVPLADLSLEGRRNKDLRLSRNRAVRDGLTFDIVGRAQIGNHVDELKGVSDAWLAEHRAAEKSFSMGAFAEDYIRRFDVAVVRHERRIVAFANLLAADDKSELSIDLMRHNAGDLHGVMDFLFAELMLWGKAQGYFRFNLGMAPLSGLENRPLAPVWHRAGALVFQHGERFYNFRGLRRFKEKFGPEWIPRYLAFPGGLSLPVVLVDVSALVSGGLKEVISK